MRTQDGQEGWNAGEYHEIVLHEKIVFFIYFSDPQRNKVGVAEYGVKHEAIDDAENVVIFEDFGNGQTKLTFIGNETMENAKTAGKQSAGMSNPIKLPQLLRGLRRRNKKLQL